MGTENGRNVTIAMIARLAGVSVPTVSRVINGRSDVAPDTRERVEALLNRHGYRRRSPSRRTDAALIDLVFNDLDSPWAVEIIRGVEDVGQTSGVGTVVSAIHWRISSAKQWLDNMRTRSTEGIIFVTSMVNPPLQAELRRLHLPVVIIDPAGVDPQESPTIGATNWAGSLSANQYLISLGHRRIGFIAGPPHLMCSRARMDGYRAALGAAGIPIDAALIRPGNFYHEAGFTAGTNCWPCPTRRPPSAPPAIRWRSASTRRSANGVCGCPTTSAWSASTICRRCAGARHR